MYTNKMSDTNYKGWFWDDVNKQMYRWHDLKLLMQERELKRERKGLHKQNPQKTS
jgi:hypothetical protein